MKNYLNEQHENPDEQIHGKGAIWLIIIIVALIFGACYCGYKVIVVEQHEQEIEVIK